MSIFFPTEYIDCMEDYDFNKAYQSGKRLILFDIDNTMVPHDAPADDKAIRFISKLKSMGFDLCCISNNTPERVKPFALITGISYIFRAKKPGSQSFYKAMQDAGFTGKQTIVFGDQIFTDIIGANKAHIDSVLVKPVDRTSEPMSVSWKRFPEWPIIKCFLFLRLTRSWLHFNHENHVAT